MARTDKQNIRVMRRTLKILQKLFFLRIDLPRA